LILTERTWKFDVKRRARKERGGKEIECQTHPFHVFSNPTPKNRGRFNKETGGKKKKKKEKGPARRSSTLSKSGSNYDASRPVEKPAAGDARREKRRRHTYFSLPLYLSRRLPLVGRRPEKNTRKKERVVSLRINEEKKGERENNKPKPLFRSCPRRASRAKKRSPSSSSFLLQKRENPTTSACKTQNT